MRIGQGFQQDALENAEDGHVGTDADGERDSVMDMNRDARLNLRKTCAS